MRLVAAAILSSGLLAGCASGPVPPGWQMNAQASLKDFIEAYFAGNERLATRDFARVRADIASTGRIDLLARAELTRCATRLASLELDPCTGFDRLAEDAAAPEKAYAAYLAGRWQGLDAALLPPQHRRIVAGGSDNPALSEIEEPLSRLVAAGVLFRLGRLSPAGIAAATETASANGWRRPLLAWLGVQAQRAEAAGDRETVARIRRRIDLVTSAAGN